MQFTLSYSIYDVLETDNQLQYLNTKTEKFIKANPKPGQDILDFERVVDTTYLRDIQQTIENVLKIFDKLEVPSFTFKEIKKEVNV